MSKGFKRSLFKTSKFQRPVLNLLIGFGLAMATLTIICLAFLFYSMVDAVESPERSATTMKTTMSLALVLIPFIAILGVVLAYVITNRLLGPFERILRELDEVVAGRSKGPIGARKCDLLANEILERVNVLISKTPPQ